MLGATLFHTVSDVVRITAHVENSIVIAESAETPRGDVAHGVGAHVAEGPAGGADGVVRQPFNLSQRIFFLAHLEVATNCVDHSITGNELLRDYRCLIEFPQNCRARFAARDRMRGQ